MTAPISTPGAPLPMPVRATPTLRPDSDVERLRHAAQEFESVFLAEMLAPMFEGLDTDGLGGGGMGEEIFRPMLIERYAQSIAQNGGVGVADSIVRELMRMQETVVEDPQAPEARNGADR